MSEKAKILIVEDERIIALEMRHKLESMGYDVSAIVSSGEEAILKTREIQPDLVLMGIVLQGEMDGVEAAGQIRNRFDIPVVYVTAQVSDARLEDIIHSGPFGCLLKPFEDVELQAAVTKALYRHKMEMRLRESERRYRALYERSFDGVYLHDFEGNFIDANPAALKMLGFEREDIPFMNFLSLLSEDQAPLAMKVFQELERTGTQQRIAEFRLMRKDGDQVSVETNASVIYCSEKPYAIQGIARDINERKRAVETLSGDEKKLRAILDASPIGIALAIDRKLDWANDALYRMVGYGKDSLVGKSPQVFYADQGEYERIGRELYAFTDTSGTGPIETVWVRKDGTDFNCTLRASSLDPADPSAGQIVTVVDVSDLHRVHRDLEENERILRLITENMYDMIRLTDAEGTNLYFSPSHKSVLGYDPEDRIGRSNFEVVHPDDLGNVQQAFAEAITTSVPGRVEYRVRCADGHYIWVETICNLIHDDHGRVTGTVLNSRDITERRRTEETLRDSEMKYRTLAETTKDGIFVLDLNGRFTYVNPVVEKLTGYTVDTIIGHPFTEFIAPEYVESTFERFKAGLAGEDISLYEIDVRHKGGEAVPVELNVSSLLDATGKTIGRIGVARDITERRRADEEIKSYQNHSKLINQILRHDLTNDFVVIQSALDLYNRSFEDKFLKEISLHVKKSIELINRMKELEDFISRHRTLQICTMKEIIDGVIKNYPSITFRIRGKAQVMADGSLSSVIDNIIRNALIHGKADTITITTVREREMCEVRIADNGVGIPDEIKKTVFEKEFIHGDTGNTGIGLHIVRKAMESYGGYAYVEDNETKGTVIVLKFKWVK